MASFLANFTAIMSSFLLVLVVLGLPLAAEQDFYAVRPVETLSPSQNQLTTLTRPSSRRFRSRLLTASSTEPYLVRNGTGCLPGSNVCDGGSVPASVYCCQNQCRNLLTDKNNCGACQKTCPMGELCCDGFCTIVAYNATHCGKCDSPCRPGQACEYGNCGYA